LYPARFDYFAPGTIEDALALLDRFGEEGKVLAGGQSLIPLMKLRFAAPRAVVDINRIPGLDGLEAADGGLRIGALVRHRDCERSPLLKGRFGALGAAAPLISDPIVRNLGTIAGSLAHADPQGDWGSVMLAAGAEVRARSSSGERTIPVEDLLLDPLTTSLAPNEVIVDMRVPDPGARAGGTYLKLERRVGDFATVGVAVQLSFSGDAVSRAGIALTGVAPINRRAAAAEQALAGAPLSDDAIREAARLAADTAEPHDDLRGTADFKRNVVRVFVERGIRAAAAAADGAQPRRTGDETFSGHETVEGVMDEIREKQE
jgi:carbon-monoxide dehydrogenase medium subunit